MGRHAARHEGPDDGPDVPIIDVPVTDDVEPSEQMSLRARLGMAAAVAVTALLVAAWAGAGWDVAAMTGLGAGVVVLAAAWVAATSPRTPGA